MTAFRLRWLKPAGVALRIVLTAGSIWVSCDPLRAIDECTAKTAPQSAFTGNCGTNSCTFRSTTPTPPSGISLLEWNFGDGESAAGSPSSFSQVTHTYPATGGYFLVTLTVTDGNGSMSVATQGFVVGSATVPLTAPDAFSTEKNTSLAINIDELLANDAPGVIFAGTSGKCIVGGTTCTYQPPAGIVGTDSFLYYVRAGSGTDLFPATVTITIVQPLVATPDEFETGINVPLDLTFAQLTVNDLPDNALVTRVANATHGDAIFVQLKGGGTIIRFTPEHNFAGYAGFDYQISLPGESNTEWGSVSVHVIDQPPTASFIIVGGACVNRTCTVRPFATDDLGISSLTWNWGDGVVTDGSPWADQTHTYAHSGHFTITQTVVDTTGHTASYSLEVTPNTPPVPVNDSASTDRDVPVTIPILANDIDGDADPLLPASINVSGYPGATWQLLQNGSSYSLKVTPPDSFVGTMTLTYIVCDPWATCSTTAATVTITVNQWPAGLIVDALGDQFYVGGSTFSFHPSSLLVNDYASNTPLHIEGPFDTSILSGRLDCTTQPDLCIFSPAGGGYTLLKYKACDPGLHCDIATVRLYVQYRGHSPIAVDDYLTTAQNTSLNFTLQSVLANDSDSDGDTLSVAIPQPVSWNYGSVTCSTPMYFCTYTPGAGYTGTDRLQYTSWDGINAAVTGFINITTLPPTTPAFDAREDVRSVTGSQLYIPYWSLVTNDFDPAGYAISVTAVDASRLTGSLTCDSGGCLYQYGSPTITRFSYTASNGHGGSDTAFVRIHVGASNNNAPVPATDGLTTAKNVTLRFSTFELLRNDYDADNDPLAATILPANTAKGTLSCDAKNYWCTYVPKPNATGIDTLAYTLTDGITNVTSTFTVNILP